MKKKLIFLAQPQNVTKAVTLPPVSVAVVDENGDIDRTFAGKITLSLDREPIVLDEGQVYPPNSTPFRFRASSDGFLDIVSNVFFVLEPMKPKLNLPDKYRKTTPPSLVFHYTDRNGMLGIIRTKSVWATHIRYLNDSSEYSYTSSLALTMATPLSTEIADEVVRSTFLEFQNNLSELEFNTHYFVFSMSGDGGDRLSQWRAYGKPGDAYSLGFESAGLLEIANAGNGWFIQCIYEPASQQELLRQFLNKYIADLQIAHNLKKESSEIQIITREALGTLDFLATYFKDPGFSEENEWRLVLPSAPGRLVKYRNGKSLVTPYLEVPISLNGGNVPLSHISLGPTPHVRLDNSAVGQMCRDHGIFLKECTGSSVPFRSW